MKKLKILIVTEEGGQFIFYKPAIGEILKRGHSVTMLFLKKPDERFALPQISTFELANPGFRAGQALKPVKLFSGLVIAKRRFFTYRRVLGIAGRPAFHYKRLIPFLPAFVRPFCRYNIFYFNSFIKSRAFGHLLRAAEDNFPPDKNIIAQLGDIVPDVIIASTGNASTSSPENDYLKAAESLSIPKAVVVMSWDHLHTKASIQIVPDILFVWNEHQAEEAGYHDIPRDRIRMIGSLFFQQWFEPRKAASKDEFCKKYGLDPKKPILTYLASSTIFGDEIEHLRKIYKAIAGLGIQLVVRKYPAEVFKKLYKRRNLFYSSPESSFIRLIPDGKSLRPYTEEAAQVFYDTIMNSFAYIGIGNTGIIDGMVMGRPGIVLKDPYYNDIQSESPYFKHLLGSGALHTAEDTAGLRNVIVNLMEGKDWLEQKRHEFIRQYLRPMGTEIPVEKLLADEIEKLCELKHK